MAENSFKRGYSKSQFPAFTQEEKDLVRGVFSDIFLGSYSLILDNIFILYPGAGISSPKVNRERYESAIPPHSARSCL